MHSDPKIKEHVQNYLEGNHHHHHHHQQQQHTDKTHMISTTTTQLSRSSNRVTTTSEPIQARPSRIPTIIRSPIHSSSKSCPQSPHDQKSNKTSQQQHQQPQLQYIQKSNGGTTSFFASHTETTAGKKKCGFEAYMMTGDLILNLSRNQQSADILTTQFKKVSAAAIVSVTHPLMCDTHLFRVVERNRIADFSIMFSNNNNKNMMASSRSYRDKSIKRRQLDFTVFRFR